MEQRKEEVLFGSSMGVKEMIEASPTYFTLDPDVLEGHNVFTRSGILVARLETRSPALLGRDGSLPRIRRSAFTVAERT
jgi:hypothetical protein